MGDSRRDPVTAAALARLYDVDMLDDPGDLDLYLALAARTGGPVLELASGSGRLAVPLAEAGFEVTAVDLDTAMLDRLRTRAQQAGAAVVDRMTVVEADLVGLPALPGAKFRLAILGLNSVMLLESRDAQRAAFETMARHLAPGGLAVVDAWLPAGEDLSHYDGRLSLEYCRVDPETGLVVTKMASAQHQAGTGQVALTAIYDESGPGGSPIRWIRQDQLRLVDADGLRGMAQSAGLAVEVVAGDYDLEPISAHDERAILVARRRGRLRTAALI
jgi:Methylase involved in ubiquinone/menaquinone biosynthesis